MKEELRRMFGGLLTMLKEPIRGALQIRSIGIAFVMLRRVFRVEQAKQ
jgi:hypothetical protein